MNETFIKGFIKRAMEHGLTTTQGLELFKVASEYIQFPPQAPAHDSNYGKLKGDAHTINFDPIGINEGVAQRMATENQRIQGAQRELNYYNSKVMSDEVSPHKAYQSGGGLYNKLMGKPPVLVDKPSMLKNPNSSDLGWGHEANPAMLTPAYENLHRILTDSGQIFR